jgi:nicotinamide-nucleotide amidase
VGDYLDEIDAVLRCAVDRCDVVIATGGLGPTQDDLTREAVAQVAGVTLEFRQDLLDEIEEIFQRVGYQMPSNNRRQAFVPEGSQAISNPVGTAPAFIKEINGTPLICLPGVPRELKHLLKHDVVPWLRKKYGLAEHRLIYRVLKTAGIGESKVDRLVGDYIRPGSNPEVGLLASMGEVKIRIAARAKDSEDAEALIRPVEKDIISRLGNKIYGSDDDTLAGVIDSLLAIQELTLAVAETFSNGVAAQRLHRIASGLLVDSRVIPDKKRAVTWLGLDDHHEIDGETALAMAHQVREEAQAGVGLAILGFPWKAEKAYALEGHVAVAGEGIERVFSWEMGGDLFTLEQRGAIIGLNTLRLALLE